MKEVLARLFSTKTLVRVAFTTLSLHCMGSAFGQGSSADTRLLTHATTYRIAQPASHGLNAQHLTSELCGRFAQRRR
jgi:hypothetical protein